MIDEFVELEPTVRKNSSAPLEPVMISVLQLGKSAPRLSISIAEAVMADVGYPRYAVAWNADKLMFKIRATPDGRFEAMRPARSKPGQGRYVICVPLASGLVAVEGFKASAGFRLAGRELLINVPAKLWANRK